MREEIPKTIQRLNAHFASGATLPIRQRREALQRLRATIRRHQSQIEKALWNDLHKSPEESYLTEISIVIQEIDLHLRKLRQWTKPRRVATPIQLWPSRSRIEYQPLGTALIIAPWNYPFQLALSPLVGALSAGCCAVVCPSAASPHTSQIIEEIVCETFDDGHVAAIRGSEEQTMALLGERFDLIFFTGGSRFARVVMGAAAAHLTPTIMELGGKSPCIVDRTADIPLAARRIAWGKWLNAGQTCVAPDYVMVDNSIRESLLAELKRQITKLYGSSPQQSLHYVRIINHRHFDRLAALLDGQTIYHGGQHDRQELYIAPTIITANTATLAAPIMQEEIFGPLLPVIGYDHAEEVLGYINSHPKPLALYYFGRETNANEVLRATSSGGTCVNDTIMHVCNPHLPFGGVGESGTGRYHGRESFVAFSHQRSVVVTPTWVDTPFRYAPYKFFNWIKRIL